jgi:LPS-assembly lipoprotein
MLARRALFGSALGWAIGLVPSLGLSVLASCGWEPLYANREAGPADEELRAIRVAPIPERIGEQLAQGLRQSLNPSGEPTPQRYLLKTTLTVQRQDLGVQTQGLGTRGRLDVYASFSLSVIKSGTPLLTASSHVAESFDILANEYANVVAENDARSRTAEEIRRDIMTRLTVFLQHRAAEPPAKPVTP